MLEILKKEVYEANMELPQRGWLLIPGEMSAVLIGSVNYL